VKEQHWLPGKKEEFIMRTHRNLPVILMLLLGILLSACNFPMAPPPTQPPELGEGGPEEPAPPTQEPTAEPPQPTPEPTTAEPPTETPSPTALPPSPTPGPTGCIDSASFIADVTIPDGTTITTGDAFTKTWRLRNTGTCTWTSSYALVFSHGDQMGGASAVPFTGAVSPGNAVDLSVDLVTPGSAGTYQGFWKLRNNSGVLFGIGSGANNPFWVKIVAQPPGPTPTVTPTGMFFFPTLILPLYYADFEIQFVNWHACGSLDYATFRVENTGNVNLESIYIQIRDLTDSTYLYTGGTNSAPWLATSAGCPPAGSVLEPGDTSWVAASVGATAPSGHTGRVKLKACSLDGMTGFCKEKTHDFVFP
jgi:hypothetical protein